MFGRTWCLGMALLALMMGSGCKLIEDRQREREREREFEREQMMGRFQRGNPCCPNPCCPPGGGGYYPQPSGFSPQGYNPCACQ